MKKLLNDILTGQDNRTYDNGRVLCLLSHLIYFSMGIGSVLTDRPWGPMDFAAGISTMIVGFGINLRLKRSTEPKGNKKC